MMVEEALVLVDTVLTPQYLNQIQETVLRESWEGRTYSEIARRHGYDPEYIKNVGFHLWQSLSKALGEKVTKSNFRSIVRRRSSHVASSLMSRDDISNSLALATPRLGLQETQEPSSISRSAHASLDPRVSQQETAESQQAQEFAVQENIPTISEVDKWKATTEKEGEKERGTERESKFQRVGEPENSLEEHSTNSLFLHAPFFLSSQVSVNRGQDWEKAIDVSVFYGRTAELKTIKQWLVEERCRLVALFGMGGIGKTTLSWKLTEEVSHKFEYVSWRSLIHPLPVTQMLANWVQFFSKGRVKDEPADLNALTSQLMEYLRRYRCLLVLDDVETILRSGECAGYYQEGYEDYGELFRRLGEEYHESAIVLISREQPRELASLSGKKVRSLHLRGLSEEAAREIFQEKGYSSGQEDEWRKIIQLYQGNPLALKIASTTIQELFNSNIAEFLTQGTTVFDEIRELIEQQFYRLSALEKEIMYWLAVDTQAVSLPELRQNLTSQASSSELLEALASLKRRSLIEESSGRFTQQPVVREYVKSRLFGQIQPKNKSHESLDEGRYALKRLLQI